MSSDSSSERVAQVSSSGKHMYSEFYSRLYVRTAMYIKGSGNLRGGKIDLKSIIAYYCSAFLGTYRASAVSQLSSDVEEAKTSKFRQMSNCEKLRTWRLPAELQR